MNSNSYVPPMLVGVRFDSVLYGASFFIFRRGLHCLGGVDTMIECKKLELEIDLSSEQVNAEEIIEGSNNFRHFFSPKKFVWVSNPEWLIWLKTPPEGGERR